MHTKIQNVLQTRKMTSYKNFILLVINSLELRLNCWQRLLLSMCRISDTAVACCGMEQLVELQLNPLSPNYNWVGKFQQSQSCYPWTKSNAIPVTPTLTSFLNFEYKCITYAVHEV